MATRTTHLCIYFVLVDLDLFDFYFYSIEEIETLKRELFFFIYDKLWWYKKKETFRSFIQMKKVPFFIFSLIILLSFRIEFEYARKYGQMDNVGFNNLNQVIQPM